MTREQIDSGIEWHNERNAELAAVLLTIDGHPGYQSLRAAHQSNNGLSGVTLRRWTECDAAMTALWAQFGTHRTMMERVETVRARRNRPNSADLGELTTLLTDPVVELDENHHPVSSPGIGVAATVPLTALVERMRATGAVIVETLTEADAAWARTVGQLDPLRDRLAAARELAASLNSSKNRVDHLAERFDQVRAAVLSDPLGADEQLAVRRFADELAELFTELSELSAVRDGLDQRLAALRSRCAELDGALVSAREIADTVRTKIANPGMPTDATAHEVTAGQLRARIDDLPELARSGRWQQFGASADQLDRAIGAALADVQARQRDLAGLVERRAELRGRLAAYQAKARGLGHTEDLDLIEIYRRAYDLLFTAPCDLAAATVAVNTYRAAIRDRTEPSNSEPGDSEPSDSRTPPATTARETDKAGPR